MAAGLKDLKEKYDASKAYIEYVHRGNWMAGRKDVSDFWAKFLSVRQNYPSFNQILCMRRGSTYAIGDRGGSDIDLEKERLHAETAFWNISPSVPTDYWQRIKESSIGAPFSFEFDGQMWSAGGITNALTAHRIVQACREKNIHQKPLRVLEIGAGYGQVAWQLFQQLQIQSYAICDLPENLFLSSFYLQANFPEKSADFIEQDKSAESHSQFFFAIPPFLRNLAGKFDLIINSYSLQEMNLESVNGYFEFAAERLESGGLFYSLNSHGKAGVRQPKDYPLDKFDLDEYAVARRYPFQIFATTPYEVILSPKTQFEKKSKISHFNALGHLVQFGIFEELGPITKRFSTGRLSPSESEWLESVSLFFEAKMPLEKKKILQSLKSIEDMDLFNIFLEAALSFTLLDWKSSKTLLEKFTQKISDSHVKLLSYLMIYASAANIGDKRSAKLALQNARMLTPPFISEINYWAENSDAIRKEISTLLRMVAPRKAPSLRTVVSKAKQKLKLSKGWRRAVGYK
jgi:SAM-dependent methyltransferase